MCIFGDRKLAYSGAKVQSRIYPGDLVIRTGDSFCMWETKGGFPLSRYFYVRTDVNFNWLYVRKL